jgi:hypothetical protein
MGGIHLLFLLMEFFQAQQRKQVESEAIALTPSMKSHHGKSN